MTGWLRLRRHGVWACWAMAAALAITAPLLAAPSVTGLSAGSCPASMVYDSVMDLCVPRGMSYDGNFVPPPTCGGNGPAICRGPKPRPPAPGGIPVQAPGGHYRPGARY